MLTAPFTYSNTGYAFVTLGTIALYGWLLERRHGPSTVLALFAIGGIGGVAATAAIYPIPIVLGANGAALAMLCALVGPRPAGVAAPVRTSTGTCSEQRRSGSWSH